MAVSWREIWFWDIATWESNILNAGVNHLWSIGHDSITGIAKSTLKAEILESPEDFSQSGRAVRKKAGGPVALATYIELSVLAMLGRESSLPLHLDKVFGR